MTEKCVLDVKNQTEQKQNNYASCQICADAYSNLNTKTVTLTLQ